MLKIKTMLSILLAIFFVLSSTAAAASAYEDQDTQNTGIPWFVHSNSIHFIPKLPFYHPIDPIEPIPVYT